MSEHRLSVRWLWILGIVVLAVTDVSGQSPQLADPAAAEEAREQRGMERFLSLLEKNPRRSTALDRVYGYHVERGTLDTFIKSFQDRVDKNPQDGTGWLILGLLEGQRGQDAAAVKALQKAEATRNDDPLPPYYLGQALVLVGQPEQAAAPSNAPSLASLPAPISSKSSRLSAASTSAPRKPTKLSRSGTGSKPSSPTTQESANRSPPLSPMKISPPPRCPATNCSPPKPPTLSARSSSPCRPPT